MSEVTEEYLLGMKRKVNKLKVEQAENAGKMEILMSALKKLGCDTIDDAKAQLEHWRTEYEELEEAINVKVANIEAVLEKYD